MRESRDGVTGLMVQTNRAGRVYVADSGRGEPVLLLHGISSSSEAFCRQMQGLTESCRLIAWDAPGYARSEDPPGPLDLREYARAAVEVLDVLGVGRVHVAGVSWGGVIATCIALHHPGRVASLTLVGSTPGRGGNPDAIESLRQRSESIRQEGVAAYAESRAPFVLAPGSSETLVEEVRRRISESVRMPGYGYAAESLAKTDHRSDLAKISAPTLVMVGEHDIVTGLDDSRELARLITESDLILVPGAGHLANQENPDFVNRELRMHWESCSMERRLRDTGGMK